MKERKAREQRFDAAMERHRQRLYVSQAGAAGATGCFQIWQKGQKGKGLRITCCAARPEQHGRDS